jgi:hypothetical protein
VERKEDFEQLAESYLRRFEGNLDDFGMARRTGANLIIRRIRHLAAGVSGNDAFDATELLEDGFDAPEASASKGGCG